MPGKEGMPIDALVTPMLPSEEAYYREHPEQLHRRGGGESAAPVDGVYPMNATEEAFYLRYPEQLAYRLSPEYAEKRAAYEARLREIQSSVMDPDMKFRYPDAVSGIEKNKE